MFIFQIVDPANVTGAENKKNISNPNEEPDSVLQKTISQVSDSGPVENPLLQLFSGKVNIDLDNDGKIDYRIESGKIYHDYTDSSSFNPNYVFTDEVASIPGVDLKKLSDDLVKSYEETMSGSYGFFDNKDINGDGKIDKVWEMFPTPPPIQSIGPNLYQYVSSIIANAGDFSKIDPKILSNLADSLAKTTKIPVDENKIELLREFFQHKAFPKPPDPNILKPALDVPGLQSIKVKDLIDFWKSLDKPCSDRPPFRSK